VFSSWLFVPCMLYLTLQMVFTCVRLFHSLSTTMITLTSLTDSQGAVNVAEGALGASTPRTPLVPGPGTPTPGATPQPWDPRWRERRRCHRPHDPCHRPQAPNRHCPPCSLAPCHRCSHRPQAAGHCSGARAEPSARSRCCILILKQPLSMVITHLKGK